MYISEYIYITASEIKFWYTLVLDTMQWNLSVSFYFHFSLMITQDIYPDTCTQVFSHKITSDSTCKTIISRNSQIPCLQDIQIKLKLIPTNHPKTPYLSTVVSSHCLNLLGFCCHQVLPHSSTLQHRTKHRFTSKHKYIWSPTICYQLHIGANTGRWK